MRILVKREPKYENSSKKWSKNGAKIHQKSLQKYKKGGPKNSFENKLFFDQLFHWISDRFWFHFWCFCSYLYHSHMQPSKSSKTIVFPMNFQRSMIFSVTSFSIYFFWQKDAKMDPQSDQNETQNHKKNWFLRFWGVLEEDVFSRFLETKKIGPKSRKIKKKIQK